MFVVVAINTPFAYTLYVKLHGELLVQVSVATLQTVVIGNNTGAGGWTIVADTVTDWADAMAPNKATT